MWIQEQIKAGKCDQYDVRAYDSVKISDDFSSTSQNKIYLGYVGHWTAAKTKPEIKYRILPLMKKTGADVYYNNTACQVTEDPDDLQRFMNTVVKNQVARGQRLIVDGSQPISIGMWDSYLSYKGSTKLNAIVGTDCTNASIPACDQFLGRECAGTYSMIAKVSRTEIQEGSSGLCHIGKDQMQLTCRTHEASGKAVWVQGKSVKQLRAEKDVAAKWQMQGATLTNKLFGPLGFKHEFVIKGKNRSGLCDGTKCKWQTTLHVNLSVNAVGAIEVRINATKRYIQFAGGPDSDSADLFMLSDLNSQNEIISATYDLKLKMSSDHSKLLLNTPHDDDEIFRIIKDEHFDAL